MRKYYTNILKEQFNNSLVQSRMKVGITQEDMAHRLMMASRTYVELDHGKSCCSTLTFDLYLIYICPTPAAFLEELRCALEKEQGVAQ